ncbi:hypothetical protein KEM56_000061 [Ascosphaera pollenicola]|nr:hypothetical protein KEM56_000061 [Ascosphaera pollenicola]
MKNQLKKRVCGCQDVVKKVAARLAIHQLLPEIVDILEPTMEIPLKQSQALISIDQKKQEIEMPALKIVLKLVFFYWPHDEQAVAHLLYHNQDLILIAKTSFGKSIVMQAFSLLRLDTITIVIISFDQISKEQLAKIETLGGFAFFLNCYAGAMLDQEPN